MKKIFIFLALIAACLLARATGLLGVNQMQSGSLTYNGASGLIITNSFPIPYTTQPLVYISSTATNDTPFTLSGVTVSNFVVTVTANSTTNALVNWTSIPGYPRIITGSAALTANTYYTNVFTQPFSITPFVAVSGSITNANASISVLATTTNLILNANVSQTANYIVIGTSTAAGNNVNPISY